MCEECSSNMKQMAEYGGHIATLLDAWSAGSPEAYEYSEPFFIGGLASATGNQYKCRAPFQGPCQFCVDQATPGATITQIVVSSTPKQSGVDLTGANVAAYNDSMMDGLVLNVPANQTIPITSKWYDIRNSENTVYVLVIAGTNAAGVNLQFRQKRMPTDGGTNG